MTKYIELDCGGKKLDLSRPVVMGIINLTPDSFFEASRQTTLSGQLRLAEKMISEGAKILDLGAISTRPGSKIINEKEERQRLQPALKAIAGYFPDCIISVDTYRSSVAGMAIDHGAGIINDIYAGRFDAKMITLVASHNIPYSMMHMLGTPADMQINPHYKDVQKDVMDFFRKKIASLPSGFTQVILDPGFGFGKTVEHNYTLLNHFEEFTSFGFPVLAGLSRKSMIQRPLQIKPEDALNGTTALNTIALLKGASILRVHDVKEALEVIRLVELLQQPG